MQNFPVASGKGILFRLLRPWLTQGTVQTEILPGVRAILDLGTDSGEDLYYTKHEYRELLQFGSFLKPGQVVFDIGANIGHYTLYLSQLVASAGAVHAFEPVPNVYRHLCNNIALNGYTNIVANRLALSDRRGQVTMYLADAHMTGKSSFSQEQSGPGGQALLVNSITLDEYVVDHGVEHIDAIKIDVEGAEMFVLRGAIGLLSNEQVGLIQCEASERLTNALGYSTVDLKRFLYDFGFLAYLAENVAAGPIPADRKHVWDNLLFIHRTSPIAQQMKEARKRSPLFLAGS